MFKNLLKSSYASHTFDYLSSLHQVIFKETETELFFYSLQMFGCGAVAQLVLSGGSHGMFLTVNFAFGFAATLGILVCGQVSGNKY